MVDSACNLARNRVLAFFFVNTINVFAFMLHLNTINFLDVRLKSKRASHASCQAETVGVMLPTREISAISEISGGATSVAGILTHRILENNTSLFGFPSKASFSFLG